jgi:hypothetical protein
MRLKDWREVIFDDWPSFREATRTTIEKTIGYARKYLIRDARVAMGRVYANEAYETRRLRILSRPLP